MTSTLDLGSNYTLEENNNGNLLIKDSTGTVVLKHTDGGDFSLGAALELGDLVDGSTGDTVYDGSTETLGDGNQDVDANSINTSEGEFTGETKIRADRNSVSSSTTSGTFVDFPTTESIDNRNELDGDQHFIPDKSGWYLIRMHADFQGTAVSDNDIVSFQIYNVTNSSAVDEKETESIGGEFFDAGTTYIVNLTAGDEYRFEVTNNDNDFKVGDLSTWVKTFWYPVQ